MATLKSAMNPMPWVRERSKIRKILDWRNYAMQSLSRQDHRVFMFGATFTSTTFGKLEEDLLLRKPAKLTSDWPSQFSKLAATEIKPGLYSGFFMSKSN